MKFTLARLQKLKMPYHCSEDLDLNSKLAGLESIISAGVVHVEYDIFERGQDTYLFKMQIEVSLNLECAITLKSLPYTIAETDEELYSTSTDIADATIITDQTIDTEEAIITCILANVPMRLVAEGANFADDVSCETTVNPAFAELKKFLE